MMIEWKSGDIMTAEKLNGMGHFIIQYNSNTGFIDASYQDIDNAIQEGRLVLLFMSWPEGINIYCLESTGINENDQYQAIFEDDWFFYASSNNELMYDVYGGGVN